MKFKCPYYFKWQYALYDADDNLLETQLWQVPLRADCTVVEIEEFVTYWENVNELKDSASKLVSAAFVSICLVIGSVLL